MGILSLGEIQEQLKNLELEWAVIDGVHLDRVFEFEDFNAAISFVNRFANIANEHNHHPDIKVYDYRRVMVSTTTHDSNGLTRKDFELAKAIDKENE